MNSGVFPIENSSYFKFYLLESGEIAKNQWFLGEKFGHPVDWKYAEWNWIWNHRERWIKGMRESGNYIH